MWIQNRAQNAILDVKIGVKNEAELYLSYFLWKGSFHFVNNKSISYKIDSYIIQTVKDHGKNVVFWLFLRP